MSNNKILGVYNINDDPIDKIDEKINQTLKKDLSKYDLVIVSDYGRMDLSQTRLQRLFQNIQNFWL